MTRPSSDMAVEGLRRETAHLADVTKKLRAHPRLAENPYVRLQLAVARRFIDRVQRPGPNARQQPQWANVQMQEVGEVLKDAERTIRLVESGKLPAGGLGPVPMLTGAAVRIRDGLLVTETKSPGGPKPRETACFLGGYGHFFQIFKDVPNFDELGVTLIQDGRNGPAQGLNQDRSLTPAAHEVKEQLARAATANVKVDILTSPHYFPAWAVSEAPDMQNGSAFQNIDHPGQRAVVQAWLTKLAALLKDEPALLSYCLSNEPVYSASGRDAYSAPAWHAFLRQRHGNVVVLNQLYGTDFKSFDEVPADGWGGDVNGRRRAYDWVCFNNQHFAGWHKWMSDTLKKNHPGILTHAKIMVFFALDHDKSSWGIDPECFADATDIAGCDAYVQHTVGVGPLDESASNDYAYHWQVQEMCYDLLNSFRNQPVFNSENHPMPNASGFGRIPSVHTRAAFWQAGLHHQAAQITWVWEEPTEPAFFDCIYLRPKNIWAASRAQLDLNRLWAEVAAVNRARPRVSLLYSPASVFWEPGYATAMRTLYTAVSFMGEKAGFVSERQLAEGRAAKVEWIVVPRVTHVTDATVNAIREFVRGGGHLLLAGDESLKYDEYHRPRGLPDELRDAAAVALETGERRTAEAVWKHIGFSKSAMAVRSPDGRPAWGVEYRTVAYEGAVLMPLINMLKEPQTVTIRPDQSDVEAVDLLSGQQVALGNLRLKPMEPRFLRVSGTAGRRR